MPRSRPSGVLWRHADFLRFWTAQGISAFGARITREGLPRAAILSIQAGPVQLGALAAIAMGPAIVVGLFAGGFIDRSRRRTILIGTDLARATILLTLPLAAWLNLLSIAHLYIAAAIVGAANVLFEIASQAYLPSVVGRADLIDGNAKLGVTESLAEVGGPAIAGLLFQILSAPVAILFNVGTYLASAVFLGTIERVEPPSIAPENFDWRSDLYSGFGIAFRDALMRPLYLMNAATGFFGAFFAALYIFFAVRELGLTPGMLGLTIASGGVGAIVGAVLSPRLTRRLGIGPAILYASFGRGTFALLIPLAHGSPVAAMAWLVLAQSVGDGFLVAADISSSSLRQAVLPLGVMGRVASAFQAGGGVTSLIGVLLAGLLAGIFGVREMLWIAAIGLTATPLLGFKSPLRRLRNMPAPSFEQ